MKVLAEIYRCELDEVQVVLQAFLESFVLFQNNASGDCGTVACKIYPWKKLNGRSE